MRQDWSERGNPEAQARVQLSLSGARRGEVKRWDTGASGFVFTTCCGVWTVGGEGVVPPALTGSCFKLPWWSTSTPPSLTHTHIHTLHVHVHSYVLTQLAHRLGSSLPHMHTECIVSLACSHFSVSTPACSHIHSPLLSASHMHINHCTYTHSYTQT